MEAFDEPQKGPVNAQLPWKRLFGGSIRNREVVLIVLSAAVSTRMIPAQASPASDSAHSVAPTIGGKRNLLPVIESASFLTLLSIHNRIVLGDAMQDGKRVYSSTFASTWEHLRSQNWVHDQDPFNINQFQHPYQGAMMYGFARSSGHNFWTSLGHANVGSFIWKMAGETDPPSIDDMVTTGQAGSLLGEALYRMSDLVLKDRPGGRHHRRHEYAAALISPPSAINRRIFGERFQPHLPDSTPPTSWQVRLGANLDAVARDYNAPGSLLRRDASAEFWMAYGLPGNAGYDYKRALDYFDFQMSLLSSGSNPIENVMIRGLLKGTKTAGTNSRGIWGLYGTYDYISPYLFRVSNTAASIGTTQQYWLAPWLALQGTVLGGVGYGAAGSTTVIPSTPTNAAIRDYHVGVTPLAFATLRFIVGDRAMIDLAGREYYVSGLGSDDIHGSETIFRGSAGVNVRTFGGHTLGARFVASTRRAQYGKLPDKRLSEGTVTLAYSFLGRNHFSAVKF